uniref:Uncharacterized protein n=1 Tax=Arundo donax TaxID=35708 RepID=A0A0A9A280_ARUDO
MISVQILMMIIFRGKNCANTGIYVHTISSQTCNCNACLISWRRRAWPTAASCRACT